MTMAHGEGCAGDVVKICNARLSANLGRDEARNEFLFMRKAVIRCWRGWSRVFVVRS